MASIRMTSPPLRVHPLIKLSRWTLLLAGIFYGASKRRSLSAIVQVQREREKEQQAARKEHLARERVIMNAASLRELETLFVDTAHTSEEKELESTEK